MSTVIHLLRKDLRHLWALALAGVAFSLISTIGWYWDLWPIAPGMLVLVASQIMPMVILFIASVAVVQSDPTVGDRAFWRTRPVSPGALLAAKALFLLLVFGLPSLLVNLYLAVSMDAPAPVVLGMVTESTGMILVECLIAALAAALTSSLIQAAALMLATAIALLVVASIGSFPLLFVPWRMDMPGNAPRVAAVELFGGMAALVLVAHQFLTRRTARTAVLLVVLIPIVLFSGGRWPVSIASGSLEPGEPPKLQVSSGAQLMLVPPAVTWSEGWAKSPVAGKSVRAHTVAINAAIRSVPEGRIIQVDSITSSIRFPGGAELSPETVGRENWPYWSSQTQAEAICRALGLAAPSPSAVPEWQPKLRLFTVINQRAVELAGRRGTLTATLKLDERAFRTLVSLPARDGAHWTHDGQMWRVRSITVQKGDAVAWVQHLRATSILITRGTARPDYNLAYKYGFVLLNRSRGEFALSTQRWASPDTPQWNVSMTHREVDFGQRRTVGGAPADGPLDEAWLSGAELVILQSEAVGSFEKQVTLEDFEIPQVEEAPEAERAPYWQ
jgi:hypothetical protein